LVILFVLFLVLFHMQSMIITSLSFIICFAEEMCDNMMIAIHF
jgi:hypothetical protein